MKQTSLADFIAFLNKQSEKSFAATTVDSFFKEHNVRADDFNPFIFFREDSYGRNLIARTHHFELLALTWLPGQRTAIHDHNGQRCWTIMHSGKLSFQNYRPIHGQKKLSPDGPVQTYSAGQIVYVDDDIGVHSIANASSKPAVSIHLYAGPVDQCRVYNEENEEFEFMALDYFTDPMGLTF